MTPPSTSWQDLSTTGKTGFTAKEFRLKLPKANVTLRRYRPGEWSVRCMALGLTDAPFRADTDDAAKAQALMIIKDRIDKMATLAASCAQAS